MQDNVLTHAERSFVFACALDSQLFMNSISGGDARAAELAAYSQDSSFLKRLQEEINREDAKKNAKKPTQMVGNIFGQYHAH